MVQYFTLPGEPTGYSHPRCYARGDSDCSKTISKEHYISAKLLRRLELNRTVKVAGLSWQEPEKFDKIPTTGLSANILCERHNSALSSLDDNFGTFATIVHDYDQNTIDGAETNNVSGSMLELWMMKCLIGLTESKNISSTLKPECLDILLGKISWPKNWGLYFGSQSGPVHHSDSLLIETLVDENTCVFMARFLIQGLPFNLLMGKSDNPDIAGVFRPENILFRFPAFTKRISFKWDQNSSTNTILLSKTGTYSGPHPSWKDWEAS